MERKRRIELLLVFAVAVVIKLAIFDSIHFTDQELWHRRLESLRKDFASPASFSQESYSEHPGMPALMVGVFLRQAGLSIDTSLSLAVAVIAAACATGGVYFLRQSGTGYISLIAAAIIVIHPLDVHASPVDAAMAPLTTLFFIWQYSLFKAKSRNYSWIAGGLVLGLMLSTRLHLAVLLLFAAAWPLILLLGKKGFFKLLGGATVTAIISNPLLWHIPGQFIYATLEQVGFATGSSLVPGIGVAPVTLWTLILFAPLALISVGTAAVLILKRPGEAVSKFAVAMLLQTGAVSLFLFAAQLQSLRYYFPTIMAWESLLPVWVSFALQERILIRRKAQVFSIMAIVTGTQIFLLAYSLMP